MMIFFNKSAAHIVEKINLPKAKFINKQFSDGEVYVRINQNIEQDEEVWVIASTLPTAENILELLFLLDALVKLGVEKINLFITYFGYARQVMTVVGESNSAQIICDILKKFPLNKIYIMHAHAANILHEFLNFKNIIDMSFFCRIAKDYDIIAAPDKGAFEFAKEVATSCDKEIILLRKTRPEHDQVKIESIDASSLIGKKILLVDDIISTGRTIIEACNALKNLGAAKISAAATHGIFSGDAQERISASALEKVYITNTINFVPKSNLTKINVVDIAQFIEQVIYNPEG